MLISKSSKKMETFYGYYTISKTNVFRICRIYTVHLCRAMLISKSSNKMETCMMPDGLYYTISKTNVSQAIRWKYTHIYRRVALGSFSSFFYS